MNASSTIIIPQRNHVPARLPDAQRLGELATWALEEEARLTPKPALVDRRGSGAHADMDLAMLLRSADMLAPYFARLADTAATVPLGVALRSRLGAIGREAEIAMLAATGGINTHRGAIWALGLLVAAVASLHRCTGETWSARPDAHAICHRAALIARLPTLAESCASHGNAMRARYGARGARGEAHDGFFHVRKVALPALRAARLRYREENTARLHTLLALIVRLEDTCLLYRGGIDALTFAQATGARVLEFGLDTDDGWRVLDELDRGLIARNASPGGSADLLAATLLLDRIDGDSNHGNA